MAETLRESAHPHLPLLREDRSAARKRRPGYPSERPNRGGRGVFARQLADAAARMVKDRQAKPPLPAEIQPHLVFRVPFAEGVSVDQLISSLRNQAGLEIVSEEPEGAVIVFRDQVDLREFQRAVETYSDGPREGINPRTSKPYATTKTDFLECIEPDQMRLWSREDRIGGKLKEFIGHDGSQINPSELYVVDLELWHPRGSEGAKRALDEIRQFVGVADSDVERVLDTFSGQFILLAKLRITGAKLDALLELDIVAEADLPPKPLFDPIKAGRVTKRDLPSPPRPPEDGPRLCIIDSGITSNHPLLANNIGHAEAVLTATSSAADTHGHGTMVAGLAVFGDVRSSYEVGQFASPITLYAARVLNERNEFDDEKLIINQMREAIETFRRSPYDCRVFNLSLGTAMPAITFPRSRQTLWAEELDVLARELKVVVVVSAGNHDELGGRNAADAETALNNYPNLLFSPTAGVCDPATAAIALTVGSLAQHDTVAVVSGSAAEDIVRPLANADEPSPFTRIGPGINGAIKPELVHYGGNRVFSGFGSIVRRIDDEPGTAVMSFSNQPTQQLFAFDSGTSFAAPRVARLASLVEHGLRLDLGERPSSNLIRAVLGSSAQIPEASVSRLLSHGNGNGPRVVCGYGLPSESDVLNSHDRRVTMVYQGTMTVDHFNIFAVPIPDEFRQAHGERKIIVTLAYDPPVRRRRLDYLGIAMEFFLIRGQTIDEVHDSFTRRPSGFDARSRFRMNFDLNATVRRNCTLQRGECVMRRAEASNQNYGNEYYLVVRCERKWAPDDIDTQDFGIAVTICAENSQLYNRIALRVRQRQQARARAR